MKNDRPKGKSWPTWYAEKSKKYPFVVSALLPALITIAGVAVLSVKPLSGIWLAISLTVYAFLIFAKVALDFYSAKAFAKLSRRAGSLQAQIKHLDNVVQTKCSYMTEVLRNSKSDAELLRRSRGKLKLDRQATVINGELAEAIIEYLRGIDRGNDAHFVCKLLAPDEDGELRVIGDWYKTGGSRTPNRSTGLFLDMNECVASRLWNDRGRNIISIPDTISAETNGDFTFVHEGQRENLLSMCCFQIGDENQGDPVAIWSIDADKVGVFPEDGSSQLNEINRIFTSFALRISLESVYSDILEKTQGVYERAIKFK